MAKAKLTPEQRYHVYGAGIILCGLAVVAMVATLVYAIASS